MELQEKDIALLDSYLAGKLAGEELTRLEARLQAEPELADMLAFMRDLEPAAKASAKQALRKEMAAAHAAAIAAGMAAYNPSIPPPSGNAFLKLLKFLLKLAVTGAIGWAVWKYLIQPRYGELQSGLEGGHHIDSHTTKTITSDTIRDTVGEWPSGGIRDNNTPVENHFYE
jgi:hypothetical protein